MRSESKRHNLGQDQQCNVCVTDSFFVKQAVDSSAPKILINAPVAIQFFNQVRLADKYDNEKFQDTLMNVFKMKHAGDRGVIYALRDQYFYFMNMIEPLLTENKIQIMDSISNKHVLQFRVSDGSIYVDPNDYKGQDGVLIYTPGKSPLFWTLANERIYCKRDSGITEQYFNCPNSAATE